MHLASTTVHLSESCCPHEHEIYGLYIIKIVLSSILAQLELLN